ncbi:MAG TPA: PH domain-containing protein [Thermoanaerobaculia bacterium]|nr:PH domain-containing protein [Thermoanaerobaculia bacterium]
MTVEEEIFSIERPDSKLFTYYFLSSLLLGPFFFVILIPLYFKYHTMRYRFDSEGISMRWGILFRREISLTYARIQDIHLASNFVERWLGLARVEVQTASGKSEAELTIEGIRQYEELRDFLYLRMRGARGMAPVASQAVGEAQPGDPLIAVLDQVASEIRELRLSLERRT